MLITKVSVPVAIYLNEVAAFFLWEGTVIQYNIDGHLFGSTGQWCDFQKRLLFKIVHLSPHCYCFRLLFLLKSL